MQVTVEFGRANSYNFDLAYAIAKGHKSCVCERIGRSERYKVVLDPDNEAVLLYKLLLIVGDWRSTFVYVNGNLEYWGNVAQMVECSMRMIECVDKSRFAYCRVCWKSDMDKVYQEMKNELDRLIGED